MTTMRAAQAGDLLYAAATAAGRLILPAAAAWLAACIMAAAGEIGEDLRAPRLPALDTLMAGPEGWRDGLVGPRVDGLRAPRPPPRATARVATAAELRTAIEAARPGTVIELQPGTYAFTGTRIDVARPGRRKLQIVVRAPVLGAVRLRFSLLEGFRIVAPFWIFENLVIEGTCKTDHRCEHAFHVVGDAAGTVIQNNWVMDFNAAVKVNGKDGRYPDAGMIRHNVFVNSRPRKTDRPVTVLDFVSVSRWKVQKNIIADFAKDGGNYISYGAFFKGAGEDNVFEQNLVRCELRHSGQRRIGFSFGGGGTGRRFCRDGSCAVEQRGGIARSNVITHCPAASGIHLNKSAETLLHNNALIATRGIELRRDTTDAVIMNNVVDGRIQRREGAVYTTLHNALGEQGLLGGRTASSTLYVDALDGDLRLRSGEAILGRGLPLAEGGLDLCDQPYHPAAPDIGPIQYEAPGGCGTPLR